MGTIDRLRQIKLTKKNCQKLLELNEGFVANNYELSWIATDEEVHRFLLRYLCELSTEKLE